MDRRLFLVMEKTDRTVWLFPDNQRHENKIFRRGKVFNAVFFAVRAECGRSSADGDFLAVIIVTCRSVQDVIRFCIAVMFVQADRAKGRNDDFCVHVAFAVQLIRGQQLDDGDGTLSAGLIRCLYGVRFNLCHNEMLLLFFFQFLCYNNIIQRVADEINAEIPRTGRNLRFFFLFQGGVMVYFLKFGASWILPPGIFILALAGLAVYLWRCRRERKAAGILAGITLSFYFLCTGFVADYTMGWLESSYDPPAEPQGDVIIMLGGGAMPDVPDVDGIGSLCADPANRLLTAVRLQRMLDVPILLSGGQVYQDSGPEAQIAARTLRSLGVPAEKILVENRSINTTQNARFSTQMLREYGFSHPLLVTSAFHMKRSVLNFAKQGMEVTPYPADYQVSRHSIFHYTKLRPQTEALLNNVTVLQETLRTFVTRYLE